jgi:hypothetical protein
MDQYAIGAAIGGFAVWAAKTIFSDKSKALDKNTDAVMTLTSAVTELRTEMKYHKEALQEIPKLRKDIDAAHNKLREL